MRAPRLWAVLAGIVAAAGQAPVGIWWLSLLGLAGVFFLYSKAHTTRAAAWLGWCAGLGYFAASLFWIVEPFLVDAPRYGWLAPFALIGLTGGLAFLWAAAFWISRRINVGVLGLAALWGLAEALRAVLFTGFPWGMIGYGWLDTPVAQLGSSIGPHGLTLLMLVAASLPTALAFRNGSLAMIGLIGTAWAVGVLQIQPDTFSDKVVRIVQPNASQDQKWDPEMVPIFLDRQLALTAAQSDMRPDLVIWPETSIASRVSRSAGTFKRVADATGGAPAIVGANSAVGVQFFNGAIVLDGDGQITGRYFKHHLVPFGEYVPLGNFLTRFGIRGLAAREGTGFSAGPGPKVLEVPGIGKVLPLICYELIFPRNFRGVERADMIVQITNDAWFGKISGPYQHLAQARMRAIEQGLPLMRSANTGVSAVIGTQGAVLAEIPLGQAGFVDAPIPSPAPPTLYAKTGDWPALIVMALLLIWTRSVRRPVDS